MVPELPHPNYHFARSNNACGKLNIEHYLVGAG
jgi:hypothetical protein